MHFAVEIWFAVLHLPAWGLTGLSRELEALDAYSSHDDSVQTFNRNPKLSSLRAQHRSPKRGQTCWVGMHAMRMRRIAAAGAILSVLCSPSFLNFMALISALPF